ncbi:MAG: Rho termination factor N-terminal domain-containing protein [Acholeplasmataceae bacterium]
MTQTREELQALKVVQLREIAKERNIPYTGLKKAELIDALLK